MNYSFLTPNSSNSRKVIVMFASSDNLHFKSVEFGMISQSIGINIKPRKRIAFDIIITHSVFKFAIIFTIIRQFYYSVFVFIEIKKIRRVAEKLSIFCQHLIYMFKESRKLILQKRVSNETLFLFIYTEYPKSNKY